MLAEDDEEMRDLVSMQLRRAGYRVREVRDGGALLLQLGAIVSERGCEDFDLVISDIRLPGLSGLEALEELTRRQSMPPTVLITAFGDEEAHTRARMIWAAVLDKPFDRLLLHGR